jgi:Zn ribbon nucleic-acid-binding protein
MTTRTLVTCPKCFSPIAIRLWHEPEDDHEVVLWQCSACTHRFETQEDPAVAATELKEVVQAFWPTVLMA